MAARVVIVDDEERMAAVVAMALAQGRITEAPTWIQTVAYILLGLVWVLRAGEGAVLRAVSWKVYAFGTLGLFIYAMVDPVAFAQRMVGLNAVPEPLWWLLGAVVAFYFGARETHYFRNRPVISPYAPSGMPQAAAAEPTGRAVSEPNPALEDWRGGGA